MSSALQHLDSQLAEWASASAPPAQTSIPAGMPSTAPTQGHTNPGLLPKQPAKECLAAAAQPPTTSPPLSPLSSGGKSSSGSSSDSSSSGSGSDSDRPHKRHRERSRSPSGRFERRSFPIRSGSYESTIGVASRWVGYLSGTAGATKSAMENKYNVSIAYNREWTLRDRSQARVVGYAKANVDACIREIEHMIDKKQRDLPQKNVAFHQEVVAP